MVTGKSKFDRHKKETEAATGTLISNGFSSRLSDVDQKMLSGIHRRHFASLETFYHNQFAYRKAQYDYLKEVMSAKDSEGRFFGADAGINFHKKEIYTLAQRLAINKSGGQEPSVTIIANTSEDRSFEIFSAGAYADGKNCWRDAAFGVAINVRKEKHLDGNGDFESSAYMNDHLKHSESSTPYELFICSYGSEDEKLRVSENEKIRLMEKRREKFISDWRTTGSIVEEAPGKTPVRLNDVGDGVPVYLPIVLHDLKECEYYVIEGSRKILFRDWAAENGIDQLEGVKKHLEALELHRGERGYFDEYVALTRARKSGRCVDSREDSQDSSSLRIIGGIPTMQQRRRILETPGLKYYTSSLHFSCGYLTTAMKVHELGAELNEIFKDGIRNGKENEVAIARALLRQALAHITDGKFKGFDVKMFEKLLSRTGSQRALSAASQGLYESILKDLNGDKREIAKHMGRRGMLAWNDELGTIVMPAAYELDQTLPAKSRLKATLRSADKQKAAAEQKTYYDKITLLVAKQEMDAWQTAINDAASKVDIKVQIKDYKNGRVITTKTGFDAYDAITNEPVEDI